MYDRKSFLIAMYDQLWNNINRHILVLWQSVSVLIAASAVIYLVEKKIITLDLASTLIILFSSWLMAHSIDSAHWVNRNLAIINNIERQFLDEKDTQEIHFYFKGHRDGSMLDNFIIQFLLGAILLAIVLIFHFLNRVVPGFGSPLSNFEPVRSLPYVTSLICITLLFLLQKKNIKAYERLISESPGKTLS